MLYCNLDTRADGICAYFQRLGRWFWRGIYGEMEGSDKMNRGCSRRWRDVFDTGKSSMRKVVPVGGAGCLHCLLWELFEKCLSFLFSVCLSWVMFAPILEYRNAKTVRLLSYIKWPRLAID